MCRSPGEVPGSGLLQLCFSLQCSLAFAFGHLCGEGSQTSSFSCHAPAQLTCFHGQHGDVVPACGLPVQDLSCHNGTCVGIDVEDALCVRAAVDGIPESGPKGRVSAGRAQATPPAAPAAEAPGPVAPLFFL